MNKYKMITICSLSIVCILILSLLLPLTTSANDKESLELNLHYQNSTVDVNIIVNSEVYTGVVCKYILLDDVLMYDNLLEQTKQNGTTINLDKTEDDIYNTIIKNVNTRYVVVYVSIGNCNICDYIDCKIKSGKTNQETNNKEEQNTNQETNNKEEQNTNQETNNKEEQNTNQETNNKEEQNTNQETNNKEEQNKNQETNNNEEQNKNQETNNKEEQNTNQETNNKEEQNKNQQQGTGKLNIKDVTSDKKTTSSNNKNESDKLVVDNTEQSTQDFQVIEEILSNEEPKEIVIEEPVTNDSNKNPIVEKQPSTNESNKNSTAEQQQATNTNQTNNKDAINLQTYNKDSINVDEFEEIQSIDKNISTSSSNTNLPQTGEDDLAKILGIVIFSTIAIISYYKYQKTK